MTYEPDYPTTFGEVLDPPVRFRPSVVAAAMRFAQSKPYRGDIDEQKAKFETLHTDICAIYSKRTSLTFGLLDGSDSGTSHYLPSADLIVLCGRLSVVTYLHEFAHALGRDERGAVRWSINLFRRCFPRSFARCVESGQMLRRPVGQPRRNDTPL